MCSITSADHRDLLLLLKPFTCDEFILIISLLLEAWLSFHIEVEFHFQLPRREANRPAQIKTRNACYQTTRDVQQMATHDGDLRIQELYHAYLRILVAFRKFLSNLLATLQFKCVFQEDSTSYLDRCLRSMTSMPKDACLSIQHFSCGNDNQIHIANGVDSYNRQVSRTFHLYHKGFNLMCCVV